MNFQLWKSKSLGIIWLVILSVLRQTNGLNLTKIAVPQIVDIKEMVPLSCHYNMGQHKLNSVKWYKDDREFFRYSPMSYPHIIIFPMTGVNLIQDQMYICNTKKCTVTLNRLEFKSSGEYRCEISGDAPEFKLVSRTANMTVAALPKNDPQIIGLNRTYENGDLLTTNCTSDLSNPSANLYWFINDKKVSSVLLKPYHQIPSGTNNVQLSFKTLELRFHVDKLRHANLSDLSIHLKCVAIIEEIPQLAPRETTAIVFIKISNDDLNNQKLIKSKNSGGDGNTIKRLSFLMMLTTCFVIIFNSNRDIIHLKIRTLFV